LFFREPAVVSYPRLLKKKGVVVEKEVVTSMDIFPTFVRLAGGEVASNVDGKDILPLLMREAGGEAEGKGTEGEGDTKSISRRQGEAGRDKKAQSESEGNQKSKEEGEAEELLAFAKQFSESLGPHEGSPIFWEYMGQMAVRLGDWKLVLNGQANFFDTRFTFLFLFLPLPSSSPPLRLFSLLSSFTFAYLLS
jgi:arylsulfatase A-like enzyme